MALVRYFECRKTSLWNNSVEPCLRILSVRYILRRLDPICKEHYDSVNIIISSVCHLFSLRLLGFSITDFKQLHRDQNSCLFELDTGPAERIFLDQGGSNVDI